MTDVDVVIVGAGCAGLASAKRLRAAGLTFHLVEAMDRIGGRAWTTTTDFGIPFDIGCAWLHGQAVQDRQAGLPLPAASLIDAMARASERLSA